MTRQTFKTTDVLRLEVEQTPTGLVNLIQNPRGEYQSSWGWISPLAGTRIDRAGSTNALAGLTYFGPNPGALPSYFTSEPMAISATEWAMAAYVNVGGTGQWFRVSFEWLDAAKAFISATAQSAYSSGTFGTLTRYGSFQAPAGTAYMRLRFDIYGSNTGAVPPAGGAFSFDNVSVGKASTSAALVNMPYLGNPQTYTDVLGPTHSVNVKRPELNLGILTAEILDATLDPSQATLIRPGKRVRLMALDATVAGGTTFTPIFTGKIIRGETTYDPKRTDVKRARISLTAVDAVAQLASTPRPQGVGTVNELKAVLEGAGTPWSINGSGNQISSASYLTNVKDATCLDQIAATRDTVLGYAWVSRFGVAKVWDRASIGSTVLTTLSESVYSDLSIDYDTDRCINTVNVKLRRVNLTTGETVEVPYGPFVDQASINQWGPHEKTFTINGGATGVNDTATAVSAYAAPILAANATPAVRINSVSIPIRDAADVSPTRALLDLFDLVTVSNTNTGVSGNMRITELEHKIESGKWMLELGFVVTGNVSTPQAPAVGGVVPVLGTGESTWQALPYAAGWADYGAGFAVGQYMKKNGFLYVRGLIKRTGAAVVALTPICTLPVGFRPLGGEVFASIAAPTAPTETVVGIYVNTNGDVSVSTATMNTNGYAYLNLPPIALD